jgi:hypothetical protein
MGLGQGNQVPHTAPDDHKGGRRSDGRGQGVREPQYCVPFAAAVLRIFCRVWLELRVWDAARYLDVCLFVKKPEASEIEVNVER